MKSKRLYYTRYGKFTSHVWASGLKYAREHIAARGLGETIECEWHEAGVLPLSPFDRPASWAMDRANLREDDSHEHEQATHALTFLAHLAISSGVATPSEFLADDGVLHGWIHLGAGLTGKPKELRADLLRRVKEIEKRVPGYLPQ